MNKPMDSPVLPPMPDRQTGEPRPPHAPLGPQWKAKGAPDKRQHAAPGPPEGHGPTLEWYRDPGVPIPFVVIITGLLMTTIASFAYGGFEWVEQWYAWLIIVLCAVFPIIFTRPSWHCAGADWYRQGKTGRAVKTYELVSVKITPQGPQLGFDLQDRDGQVVLVKMEDMQKNRELWDLVYNGILHSVYRNGATTNENARKYLQLEQDQ